MNHNEIFVEDINAMTSQGVMSGPLIMKVNDGKVSARYSFAEDDEMFSVEKNSDDSLVKDTEELQDKISQWFSDGEKPRDEDGNVIPFTY